MESNSGATLEEIRMQTGAWAEAVKIVQNQRSHIEELRWVECDQMLFIGCGSTYYLSLSAATLFQSLSGKISRAFPSSELLLSPSSVYPEGHGQSMLVAISRSGKTSETLQAVNRFSINNKGTVLTVSNNEESQLAGMGKLNFCIPSGKEQSVAQTKSFASMYVACTALTAVACNQSEISHSLSKIVPVGERILGNYEELARETGQNHALERFFFLGSGNYYGLACEASLKMKEMSLTVSEPFHFLEFRHGPISMVDKNTLVVGLLSEKHSDYEKAVLTDVQKLGGHTLTLGENNTDVEFNSNLPEPVRGVFYLPVLQLMAYYRAVSLELNPDQPRNLTAVVELEFPR